MQTQLSKREEQYCNFAAVAHNNVSLALTNWKPNMMERNAGNTVQVFVALVNIKAHAYELKYNEEKNILLGCEK